MVSVPTGDMWHWETVLDSDHIKRKAESEWGRAADMLTPNTHTHMAVVLLERGGLLSATFVDPLPLPENTDEKEATWG